MNEPKTVQNLTGFNFQLKMNKWATDLGWGTSQTPTGTTATAWTPTTRDLKPTECLPASTAT